MALWKNYCTIEKHYGTMEKTMILYRKLLSFDLLWEKYGTIENTIVL